jgi:hypothetical protein
MNNKRGKYVNRDGKFSKGRYVPTHAKMYIPESPFRFLKSMKRDLTQILPSGYSVGQTRDGLDKAWLGYVIGLKKNEKVNTVYYASVIQKLQRELVDAGVLEKSGLANFPQLKMYALGEKKDYAKFLHNERVNLDPDEYEDEEDEEDDDMKRQRNWLQEVYNSDGFERVKE